MDGDAEVLAADLGQALLDRGHLKREFNVFQASLAIQAISLNLLHETVHDLCLVLQQLRRELLIGPGMLQAVKNLRRGQLFLLLGLGLRSAWKGRSVANYDQVQILVTPENILETYEVEQLIVQQ